MSEKPSVSLELEGGPLDGGIIRWDNMPAEYPAALEFTFVRLQKDSSKVIDQTMMVVKERYIAISSYSSGPVLSDGLRQNEATVYHYAEKIVTDTKSIRELWGEA